MFEQQNPRELYLGLKRTTTSINENGNTNTLKTNYCFSSKVLETDRTEISFGIVIF